MPRVGRYRTREYRVSGTLKSWVNAQSVGPPDSITSLERIYTSSCNDQTGSPVSDSPFSSSQHLGALTLDGTVITEGNRKYVYESYPSWSQLADPTTLGPPNGWVLDLIAGTNPSRPVITPPEMLQNLIELPSLLRQTFAFLANPRKRATFKHVADDYLALKFGWMPFVEDLSKLLDLQSYVIKRRKELSQLYSGKGLRRRLRFGNQTTVEFFDATSYMEGTRKIRFDGLLITKKESWGTARWHPTAPPPFPPSDERMNSVARNLVLGMTSEGLAKGLWAVIPWTWLLGWFTNVGKFTLANSNTIPAVPSHLNFMSKATVTRTIGGGHPSGIAYHNLRYNGFLTRTRRTRVPGTAVALPGLSMPDLDIGRLSVLAALAVQRIKR